MPWALDTRWDPAIVAHARLSGAAQARQAKPRWQATAPHKSQHSAVQCSLLEYKVVQVCVLNLQCPACRCPGPS